MRQETLAIPMDEDIKERFDKFCENVGMSATTAVNMFARAVLREKRIPFEIMESEIMESENTEFGASEAADPFFSAKNQARLAESIAQLESGGAAVHELFEVGDE